jgi:hypothetical protein
MDSQSTTRTLRGYHDFVAALRPRSSTKLILKCFAATVFREEGGRPGVLSHSSDYDRVRRDGSISACG